jgi:hypothetical protein
MQRTSDPRGSSADAAPLQSRAEEAEALITLALTSIGIRKRSSGIEGPPSMRQPYFLATGGD